MTAVEWLIDKISEKSIMEKDRYYIPYNSGSIDITDLIEQAKQMEKEQTEISDEEIEKAAENYGWRIKTNTFSDAVKANELAESAKQDFIEGAKWQQERMYSEADKIMKFLDTEIKLGLSDSKTIERVKWYFETYFEQFKKK